MSPLTIPMPRSVSINTQFQVSSIKFQDDASQTKKIYQAMTPEQKIKIVFDLYHSARELKRAYLKELHPDWSENKIQKKFREIFLYARS